ncbi:hypothetical protein F2P56_036984 [Juglans regia]|uniref:Reverse transcriptase domain-containing protein n=2 Tax=Juglans regia TaxID=51240 RepID=A0A833WAV8_JUGRE|nr:uncharacterized protein LOC108985572 [Juglans regia]KAF5441803.1 hypothetical protein F2P56_036984 [Juglans regia]
MNKLTQYGNSWRIWRPFNKKIRKIAIQGRKRRKTRNRSPDRRRTTNPRGKSPHQRNSGREEPPIGEISTIAGGYGGGGTFYSARKAHARRARYEEVFSAYKPSLNNRDQTREYLITFSEKDGEGLSRPYDDALVVTAQISNYRTRRVLIDKGSSADVLFWEAFTKMKIAPYRLRHAPTPLKGFTGDTIQPVGAMTLSILVGMAPKTTSLMVDFLVVKASSSYNAILGCPSLNKMKVVTSTYHLKALEEDHMRTVLPPPPALTELYREVRDEEALRQAEPNEPLVLIPVDPEKSERTV